MSGKSTHPASGISSQCRVGSGPDSNSVTSDYNYERQNDGSCALVLGLSPADHALVCESDSVLLEYHEPTGYRRIPLTTCVGGKEMDLTSVSHPCPGREEELYKAKKSSKLLIFMISVVCLAIMSGAAYFVYGIWSRRYGSIRLGSNELSSSEGTLLRTAAKSGHAFAIAALDFLLRMSIAMQQAVSSFLSRRRSSYGERAAWSRPIYSEDDISDVGLLAEDDDEEA